MAKETYSKEIYRFEVNVELEVEESVTTNENGQEVVRKSKVKKQIPHTFVMKKPARTENDSLRLFYGRQMRKAVDAGLLTKAILVNNHIDGAGALLSKETAKRVATLAEKIESTRNDLIKMGIIEPGEKLADAQSNLLTEHLEAQRELQAIESANQAIFANTAETYAQEKANMWLILFETFILDKFGKLEPYFKGKEYEDKEDYLFDLEEDEKNELFKAARQKLAYFWGAYAMGSAEKPEDFKKLQDELLKAESNLAKKTPDEAKTEEKVTEVTAV